MNTTIRPLNPTHPLCSTLLAAAIALGLTGVTTEPAAASPSEQPMMGEVSKVDGGLDKPAVREVVRANIDDVRVCYNAELLEDEDLGGEIVMSFTITGDGTTEGVEVPKSTMPERFDRCMIAAVSSWTFPAVGEQTQVSYPFMMEPG